MFVERFSLFAVVSSIVFCVACSGSSSGESSSTDGGGDGDATSETTGSCRAMGQHRPSADLCASNADAGPVETGCGGTFTPHDDCLKDDDCASAHGELHVCACEAPRGFGCGTGFVAGNQCLPSNCHVDSDCSKCGECRLEQSCGFVTGYYCATASDECSTNADCPAGFCKFTGDRWKCDSTVACAG